MDRPARRLVPAFVLALVLLVSGCAQPPPEPRWEKAGATAADREAAIEACLAEAETVADADVEERTAMHHGGRAFLRCMQGRGWVQVVDAHE